MTNAPRIEGRGGGGRKPQETTDNLRSAQRVEIVDLISEGHIAGLVNGLKSVFLDGVPVENPDGSRNFGEFSMRLKLGGPTDATPEGGFATVQTEVGVAQNVLKATPVVRTIADPNVDKVRVTILVPTMIWVQDDGDRRGTKFEWAIDVQSNGGGYVERYRNTVDGKTTTAFTRQAIVDLRATGPAPWDIRVRRITDDSTDTDVVNAFSWQSYTAITSVRMAYKNSAVAEIGFDARDFPGIPKRSYDMMGIDDWDIPVNYDPIARTYTGSWNGTFKQGWTNSPPWVIYNLVKNRRYGLGNYVPALPDKWVLYQLAQWCDTLVSDGRGGLEPRYTINAYIQQQSEALRLLQDIASVFRGAILYGAGAVGVTWARPSAPVASYTPANVVGGVFNYADGSRNQKKSSCTCWYNDLSQQGKRASITWDDPDLVAKYGMRRMSIDPIGITSPAAALRQAKWALYALEFEDQVVSFRVGADGAAVRIGDVFQISDPSETGERLGGRIHSATETQLTLDSPVELMAGQSYTVWVTITDPTDPKKLALEQRVVTTGPGVTSVLTVSAAFSTIPPAETMWLLEGSDVAPTLWTYVGCREVKGEDGNTEYEISGVAHAPDIWPKIENGQPLSTRPTRRLADTASTPINLQLSELVVQDGQTFWSTLLVSWQPTGPGQTFTVAWRYADDVWVQFQPTSAQSVDIPRLKAGVVEVKVTASVASGHTSLPLEGTITLLGNQAPAVNVSGLAVQPDVNGYLIKWDRSTDFDYTTTEIRLDGSDWATATPLADLAATRYLLSWPSAGVHVVRLRHKRRGGPPGNVAQGTFTYSGTPAALVNILTGQVGNALLDAALSTEIAKISASASVPGSVDARDAAVVKRVVQQITSDTLNSDPTITSLTNWSVLTAFPYTAPGASVQLASVLDGESSRNALRSVFDPAILVDAYPVPLNATHRYRISCRARRNPSAPSGAFYLGVFLFRADGSRILGDGSAWFYPASGVDPGAGPASYTGDFGAGTARTFPADAKWMSPGVVLCDAGSAKAAGAWMDAWDIRLVDVTVSSQLQAQITSVAESVTTEVAARASAVQTLRAQFQAGGAENLYTGGDLQAGPGTYGVVGAYIKQGTTNASDLRPGEKLTLSGVVWQDAVAAAAGNVARLWLWCQRSDGAWTTGAVVDSSATARGAAGSATLTLPPSEADMYAVGIGLWHQPDGLGNPGTINAARIQLERGELATAYKSSTPKLAATVTQESQVSATRFGELWAKWSVKLDVNGRWSGLTSVANGDTSAIDLNADIITFSRPGSSPQTMFAFYTAPTAVAPGVTVPAGLYARGANIDYIASSRIDTRNLTVRASDGSVILGAGTKLNTPYIEVGAVTMVQSATLASVGGAIGSGSWQQFDQNLFSVTTSGAPITLMASISLDVLKALGATVAEVWCSCYFKVDGSITGISSLVLLRKRAVGSGEWVGNTSLLARPTLLAGSHVIDFHLEVWAVNTSGLQVTIGNGSSGPSGPEIAAQVSAVVFENKV